MKSCRWIIWFLEVLISLSLSQCISDSNHKIVQNGLLNFGVKLNSILLESNTENKNILFSPYNIYTALALVHLGSNGTTRDAISTVLNIPTTFSAKNLHEVLRNFSSVAQKGLYLKKYENRTKVDVKVSDLKLANGIFVQNQFKNKLKKSYVEDVQLYHKSDIFDVDFANKSEETKDTINEYISNKTENRIPKLLVEALDPSTILFLTSSLYFKSGWQEIFDQALTKNETFYTGKANITVQMMNGLFKTRYANIPSLSVEVANLRFIDKAFSMFIVMPYENQPLEKHLRNLTSDQIRTIVEQANNPYHSNYEVDLKLPRTAFQWTKSIKQEVIKMGLKGEILEFPDLSNMVEGSTDDIKISDINHSTDIKINEDGTEASAVTSITLDLRIDSSRARAAFHANRPFFFFIYNHEISIMLFFGTVYEPNNK